MSVTVLPLDPGAQARVLLHYLLDSGDIVGLDEAGRVVIQLAADDWVLEQLLTFDAAAEDLEESEDAEADDDAEPDGATVLFIDRAPARRVYCRRQYPGRTEPSQMVAPAAVPGFPLNPPIAAEAPAVPASGSRAIRLRHGTT